MRAKELVLEFLKYCIFRVQNDECTQEELSDVVDRLGEEMNVLGTREDFSRFYGQSDGNVRNVLARRYIPENQKPRKRVLYRFGWFSRQVPSSWHNTKQ